MAVNGTSVSESQALLFQSFYDLEVFKLGEFYLKSGQMTPIYIDLRRLISRPSVLKQAAQNMCDIVKSRNLQFDYIIGVPYAAIPLATMVSSILNVPMLMRRKEAKTHGTKQMIEGIYETGKRVLLVEDVVTHGDSIRETAEGLKEDGLEVVDSISILDRQQGGGELLQKSGINYHSLLTMEIILDCLVGKGNITADRKVEIIEHLRKPF